MALMDLEHENWEEANGNVRIWADPLLMDSDEVKPRDPLIPFQMVIRI